MINSETIPEAVILEQPTAPSNADLLSALNEPTETKTPSATNNDGWRWDVEPEIEAETQQIIDNSEKPASTENTAPTETENAVKTVLSKSQIKANSELTVDFIDITQQNLSRLFLNKKFKSKYTPEEIEKLETDLIYKSKEQLTEAEQVLKAKYKTLEAKKKKKDDLIDFKDKEKKQLEKIFSDYTETTGQSLPPWVSVVLTVGQIMLSRVEVFTDN